MCIVVCLRECVSLYLSVFVRLVCLVCLCVYQSLCLCVWACVCVWVCVCVCACGGGGGGGGGGHSQEKLQWRLHVFVSVCFVADGVLLLDFRGKILVYVEKRITTEPFTKDFVIHERWLGD